MVAAAGGTDALLAYPLVGPNMARFVRLIRDYPGHDVPGHWSTIPTRPAPSRRRRQASTGRSRCWSIWRSAWGGRASIPASRPRHLTHSSPGCPTWSPTACMPTTATSTTPTSTARRKLGTAGQEKTLALRDRLLGKGLPVPRLVLGGTPSFPIHAELDVPGVECSPGTIVLHDHGYASRYPDLPFTPAALLFTRVVSRPGPAGSAWTSATRPSPPTRPARACT